jgi:methionine-rich copper-binding protein CopC
MSGKKWLVAAVLSALCAVAHAHAHLSASVPAEGSTVEAPERIRLTFSEAARVTALTIQRQGGLEQKLSPLPATSAREVSLPAPSLAPGQYTLSWRVLSQDGHVMSGTVHFSVVAGPSGAADSSTGHAR